MVGAGERGKRGENGGVRDAWREGTGERGSRGGVRGENKRGGVRHRRVCDSDDVCMPACLSVCLTVSLSCSGHQSEGSPDMTERRK